LDKNLKTVNFKKELKECIFEHSSVENSIFFSSIIPLMNSTDLLNKMIFTCILIILLFSSCGNSVEQKLVSNQSAVENYIQAFNEADTALIASLLSSDFKRLTGGVADTEGIAEMQTFLLTLKENNPDFRFNIIQVAAGVHDAAIFWEATSPGPGGKQIAWTGCSVLGINDDGKLISERVVGDRLGMMEQLGYRMILADENAEDVMNLHPGLRKEN
jgi:limonene-1,2-epoxide hydrolase